MDGLLMTVVVAAIVFGVCFLVDKGFTKLFRGKVQHQSGRSVRPNKRYGAFGLILTVLGIASLFKGIGAHTALAIGGGILVVFGVAMIVYYLTTGLFYDEDSFVYASFGKRSRIYYYRDIKAQQLYNVTGSILVELYMKDGKSVSVHGNMVGAYDFLDLAFSVWCAQKGLKPEDCPFHDPNNSCWFPPVAEEK